jgi:DNA-directed RNA polymerase subunit RPC12/RpoP
VAKNGRQWLTVIHFKCVYCGQRILAKDDGRGKKGHCPTCKHIIYVPPEFKPDSNLAPLALAPETPPKEHLSETTKDPSVITEEFPPPDSLDNLTDLYEEKLGFLIPNYDELSLFLMSAVFLILYFTSSKLQDDIITFLMRLDILRRYLYVGLFMLGMSLCLYHVFTPRQKTEIEKNIMLLFAITINAATGIIAGLYMLKDCPGWLLIFPAWNIINSALLIIMQYVNLFDETQISDRDATITQVIIGLAAILIIFYICNNVFNLHWAITYSICIIYTTSFDRGLQSVFPVLAGQNDEQTPEVKS